MIFTPSQPQKLIHEHLLEHESSLLFVGMGLGKTAAVLSALDTMFLEGMATGALIIAPLRVCNLTWPMEVENWEQFSWMKVANLRTAAGRQAFMDGKAHLYVINYEALGSRDVTRKQFREPDEVELGMLRVGQMPFTSEVRPGMELTKNEQFFPEKTVDTILPKLRFFDQVTTHHPGVVESLLGKRPAPFDVVIFDESTKGKNPAMKGLNELRKYLAKEDKVTRRWALTGTPAPNSCFDLFAQVRLVDRGARLGTQSSTFRETRFERAPYSEHKWWPREGTEKWIQDQIADITLTLHSKDWLDIPDTVLEDVDVSMGDKLARQYRDFEKEMVMQLERGEITAPTAAALVTKLLQFTSGQIYDGTRLVHDLHSLKIEALRRLLERHPGEPMLLACIFQHEQERVRAAFPQAEFFADARTQAQQMDLIKRWNAGSVSLLVAHPASCGHGLNLQHGSNLLVWFTLTYSRELYEQMICRLVRRGQDKAVIVYRLMCPGTVDDAVAEALEMKATNEKRLLQALAMLESFRNRKDKV